MGCATNREDLKPTRTARSASHTVIGFAAQRNILSDSKPRKGADMGVRVIVVTSGFKDVHFWPLGVLSSG